MQIVFCGRLASRAPYLFFWKNCPRDCLDLRFQLGLALQSSSSPNKPCVYNSLSQWSAEVSFVCTYKLEREHGLVGGTEYRRIWRDQRG